LLGRKKERNMFIVLLTYLKSLEEVQKVLDSHITYLEKYYSLQKFICSGPQNPRVGGVILCTAKDIDEVNEIIKEDPFYYEKIAKYQIIHFTPTKYVEELKSFLSHQGEAKPESLLS